MINQTSPNYVFDPSTGHVYNAQADRVNYRWLDYPLCLHPDNVPEVFDRVKNMALKAWGGGHAEISLGKDGYYISASYENRTFYENLGRMAEFENQHGRVELEKEIFRRLQTQA